MNFRNFVRSSIMAFAGVVVAFAIGEGIIRIATANQKNYIIEMWRYAKLLKKQSVDPAVGHDHIPNRTAMLENVAVRINSLGLRGPEPVKNAPHRVAIIGDSIAFGWGVPEDDTLRGNLEKLLPDSIDVINVGVGNRNIDQAVSQWIDLRNKITADTLVIVVAPRATTSVSTKSAGWLVEHSALAAIGLTIFEQLSSGEYGPQALVDGYKKQWSSPEGKKIIKSAFDKLLKIKNKDKSNIIILDVPEPHDFNDYKFNFMQQEIRSLSDKYGFEYVSTLSLLKGPPSSSYWVSDRDVHPNGKALKIMADATVGDIKLFYESNK
ncbi:hypothetical protein [uncultured Thalassospira sp.]|uniref:SGNH/GDSL hydrolase family protein n=1 Tax=uncultured Thalassospira sp. TaxID=404382 RepID=UPI0030D9C8E8